MKKEKALLKKRLNRCLWKEEVVQTIKFLVEATAVLLATVVAVTRSVRVQTSADLLAVHLANTVTKAVVSLAVLLAPTSVDRLAAALQSTVTKANVTINVLQTHTLTKANATTNVLKRPTNVDRNLAVEVEAIVTTTNVTRTVLLKPPLVEVLAVDRPSIVTRISATTNVLQTHTLTKANATTNALLEPSHIKRSATTAVLDLLLNVEVLAVLQEALALVDLASKDVTTKLSK